MNEEQKKNLLNHADFLENVVSNHKDKFEMGIYYSPVSISERDNFDSEEDWLDYLSDKSYCTVLESKEMGGECGFCACAIGWTALNKELPPANDLESWFCYSGRLFGISDVGHGKYCFSDKLNIKDPSIVASRIRKVVEAYPKILEIEDEFLHEL